MVQVTSEQAREAKVSMEVFSIILLLSLIKLANGCCDVGVYHCQMKYSPEYLLVITTLFTTQLR